MAVNEHVRFSEKMRKQLTIRRHAKIEPCASFSQCDLQHNGRLIPPGWVDPQHFCAEPSNESGCDRPGENACEVKNPQTGEWPVAWAVPIVPGSGVPCLGVEQRLTINCAALWVGFPFRD